MNLLLWILVLIISIVTAGCATTSGSIFTDAKPNPNMVSVYVYREKPAMFGTAPPVSTEPWITVNGKQMGTLLTGTYMHFYANPGEITIDARKMGNDYWGYNPFAKKIKGDKGETLFVKMDFRMVKQEYLVITIRNNWQVQFEEMPSVMALKEISETKQLISEIFIDPVLSTTSRESQKTIVTEKRAEQAPKQSSENLESKLKKLKDLHDKKLITLEQYNDHVKKVLENE